MCQYANAALVRGKVAVRDFVKRKTVIVRKGKRYRARADGLSGRAPTLCVGSGHSYTVTRERNLLRAATRMRSLGLLVVALVLAGPSSAAAETFTVTETADVTGTCEGSLCPSIRAALATT